MKDVFFHFYIEVVFLEWNCNIPSMDRQYESAYHPTTNLRARFLTGIRLISPLHDVQPVVRFHSRTNNFILECFTQEWECKIMCNVIKPPNETQYGTYMYMYGSLGHQWSVNYSTYLLTRSLTYIHTNLSPVYTATKLTRVEPGLKLTQVVCTRHFSKLTRVEPGFVVFTRQTNPGRTRVSSVYTTETNPG